MYKKFIILLTIGNIFLISGCFCMSLVQEMEHNEYAIHIGGIELIEMDDLIAGTNDCTLEHGAAKKASSGQRIVDYSVIVSDKLNTITEEDLDVLSRIVEAEAGGEDEEGKILVANVVLNRVRDENFPGTIQEVVFQSENGVTQFSPIVDGRYYSVKVSEDTMCAVKKAVEGEDNSQGALYFAARKYADSDKMKWFDNNLIFLFCHGNHEFFK